MNSTQLLDRLSDAEDIKAVYAHEDDKFCAAMQRAITAGYEHPPMIGIDTRPCTTNPHKLTAAMLVKFLTY
jgi:hypothetical protein